MNCTSVEQQVVKLAHSLASYVICAEGNVSGKTNSYFVIKPSGASLHQLTENALVPCCLRSGTSLDEKKPSIEATFHAWLLQNNNINFVAHTHTANVLKIVCSDLLHEFATVRFFPDQVIYNGAISCVVPYAKPGTHLTEQITINVSNFIQRQNRFPDVILLQNHGLICCGPTAECCLYSTMICEKAAEIFIGTKTISKLRHLRKADIHDLLNDEQEKYRKNLIK